MIFLLGIFWAAAYQYRNVKVKNFGTEYGKICVFVHGHKGHYSQGLALSEYLQDFCEFYSVDFLEDISGLSHHVIYKQAEYLASEIIRFSQESNPKIYLIGHSMGGIVSILSTIFTNSVVSHVFTLNSPIYASPLNSYFAFPMIYSKIHSFLRDSKVIFLSIAGGYDETVPFFLTNSPELKNKHICTGHLEGVYKEFTHNQIFHDNNFLKAFSQIIKGEYIKQGLIKLWANNEINEGIYKFKLGSIAEKIPKKMNLGEQKWVKFFFPQEGEIFITTDSKIEEIVKKKIYFLNAIAINRGKFFFYKLNVYRDDEYEFLFNPGTFYIRYERQFEINNFWEMVFYGKKIKAQEVLTAIVTNLEKFPVTFEFNQKIDWGYMKSGNEERIVKDMEKFTLYLRNFVENEEINIWIIADDINGQVYISIFKIVEYFFNEYRLFVVSTGIFFFIRPSNPKISAFVFILLFFCGNWLRHLGLIGIDHVDFENNHMNLLHFFLLIVFGGGFAVMLQFWYKILCFLIRKLKKFGFYKNLYFFSFYSLIFPWPGYILTVIFQLKDLKIVYNHRKLIYLHFLFCMPQIIAYFWRLYTYSYVNVIDIFDFFPIFCLYFYFLSVKFNPETLSDTLSPKHFHISFDFLPIYIQIFSQDLLYRANIAINLTLIYLSLKHFSELLNSFKESLTKIIKSQKNN